MRTRGRHSAEAHQLPNYELLMADEIIDCCASCRYFSVIWNVKYFRCKKHKEQICTFALCDDYERHNIFQ